MPRAGALLHPAQQCRGRFRPVRVGAAAVGQHPNPAGGGPARQGGGVKRIASFASTVVPFMALGYIIVACVIIALNIHALPGVILRSANGPRDFGVSIRGSGVKTTGVVRCDQPRVIDLAARHARKVDTLPAPLMDEVLAKVATLFE